MAVPKTRISTKRKGTRRANHSVKLAEVSLCLNCKSEELPHFACPVCGQYIKKCNEKAQKGSTTSKKA